MRGFYSVAAGIFTQQEQLNTIGNNIANATTTGFKAQNNLSSSFGEHVLMRMSNLNKHRLKESIGGSAYMTVNIDEYTDFTQGRINDTGRSLDMAINGVGFFVVEDDGEIQLTRSGQFELNAEGELMLKGGGYVLNDSMDRITLAGSNFKVTSSGEIFQDGESVDLIGVAVPNEGVVLKKVGEDRYTTGDNQEDFTQMEEGTFEMVQGALEGSNVDMTEQLTDMIRAQRNFQSCSEMLKIHDSINDLAVNQIGKL